MGNAYSTTAPPEDCILPMHIPQPDNEWVKKQTVVVEGSGDWGSGIHRNSQHLDELVGIVDPKVTTLWENFMQGHKISANKPCYGCRKVENGVAGEYTFLTYDEIYHWALALGSAMRYVGLERGDRVGLYSKNCVEWVAVEAACNGFAHPTVSIYDTLGPTAACYITNHAELKIVFVEPCKLNALYAVIEQGVPTLKRVVCFAPCSDEMKEKFGAIGVDLMSLEEFRKLGEEHPREPDTPSTDDVAILMYTSGTTGPPKGAVITHFNMISLINAVKPILGLVDSDIYFSFLPLSHCFERIIQCVLMATGASVGFYQGDVKKLTEDMNVLRPTVLVAVPRVFNRFYDMIVRAVNGGSAVARSFFNRAYAYRLAALRKGQDTPWFNYLLFNGMRAKIGGRVRIMITGSAPLDPRVHELLRVCLCSCFQQGYGLTESSGACLVQCRDDFNTSSVGRLIPSTEIKLADVPDMEYLTSDDPPRGEIYLRGNSVFVEYYKEPEKTRAEKDADGWLHTGDIGQWNPDGSLSIIDRKKNIFKLAQGEYIAVETLEQTYINCSMIAQIFIYGDSFKSCLLAVVVPDEAMLLEWARKNGHDGDYAVLCDVPAVRDAVQKEMNEMAAEAKLKGFERVKGIVVHSEPFTVENNLMTPTFKIKRHAANKVFKSKLDKLYEEIEQP